MGQVLDASLNIEKFTVDDNDKALALFGRQDENLKLIESSFRVRLIPRGNQVMVEGSRDHVGQVMRLLSELSQVTDKKPYIDLDQVRYAIDLMKNGESSSIKELSDDVIQVTARGKQIRPKTLGQKRYIEAIRSNGVIFAIGPAGTGKTYLGMAMAVAALKRKEVGRLILIRPAVEAGEKLGFLPGDLQDKVDPYLRPLYDALYDILGTEVFQRYLEKGIIEVAPLAYMRGRTLDDSFILLDEAQNTTPEQMKMFLTRLGFGSKAVVTGDITQVDLPGDRRSGLKEVQNILKGIDGIAFVYLSDQDVVRHHLVQSIIKAYERHDDSVQKRGGDVGTETQVAGGGPQVRNRRSLG